MWSISSASIRSVTDRWQTWIACTLTDEKTSFIHPRPRPSPPAGLHARSGQQNRNNKATRSKKAIIIGSLKSVAVSKVPWAGLESDLRGHRNDVHYMRLCNCTGVFQLVSWVRRASASACRRKRVLWSPGYYNVGATTLGCGSLTFCRFATT